MAKPILASTILTDRLQPLSEEERRRIEGVAQRNRILMALESLPVFALRDDELRAEVFRIAGKLARTHTEWMDELRHEMTRKRARPKKWHYGACYVFLVEYFGCLMGGDHRDEVLKQLKMRYGLRTQGAVEDRIGRSLTEIGGIDELPERLREFAREQRARRSRTNPSRAR